MSGHEGYVSCSYRVVDFLRPAVDAQKIARLVFLADLGTCNWHYGYDLANKNKPLPLLSVLARYEKYFINATWNRLLQNAAWSLPENLYPNSITDSLVEHNTLHRISKDNECGKNRIRIRRTKPYISSCERAVFWIHLCCLPSIHLAHLSVCLSLSPCLSAL